MTRRVFVTALVLAVLAPALGTAPLPARAQGRVPTPPPPGPYQALPPTASSPASPQLPRAAQAPRPAEAAPAEAAAKAPAPSASQIWGPPAMPQIPYWMGRPGTAAFRTDTRQDGMTPDAAPDRQGGGQALTTQLSPAGQPTALSDPLPVPPSAPGAQITPGFFPGYTTRQSGGGEARIAAGATAGASTRGQGSAGGGQGGQYGAAGQPYRPYQGQAPAPWPVPVPYWGAPMVPAYPAPYPSYSYPYPYPGQSQANR